MADIDLSDYNGLDGNPAFNLIGRYLSPAFTGVFDGSGHAISNFTLAPTDENGLSGVVALGMFTHVAGDFPEIRDLTLRNVFVDGRALGMPSAALVGRLRGGAFINGCRIEGGQVFGGSGLVAIAFAGVIYDCHVSCHVSGSTAGLLVGESHADIYDCTSSGSVTGDRAGGLLGWSDRTAIMNCRSDAQVTGIGDATVGGLVGISNAQIEDCAATGDVLGAWGSAGGLTGTNAATILRSWASGNVVCPDCTSTGGLAGNNLWWDVDELKSKVLYSYATGDVVGFFDVGGLVGDNSGTISDSYARGNATGSTRVGGLVGGNWNPWMEGVQYDNGNIYRSYSVGRPSAGSWVGGLVGITDEDTTVSDCFWDTQTSGMSTSAGGTGKTTTEMQTESTFTSAGWDFVTPIWKICDGLYYPRLSWEERAVLRVEPGDMQFAAMEGAANPGGQVLSIVNCGAGSLNWAIAEDCTWLQVEPNSGTSMLCDSNEAVVSVDMTGMSTGSYYCELTISDPCAHNSPQTVGVWLYVIKYGGGSGAPGDPYLIYTAEQMNFVGVNPSNWDKHFKLMADIDLSGYTGTQFNIIGNETIRFAGVFDGNNHEISSFTYSCTGENNIGLFGVLQGTDAQIRNVRLTAPEVSAPASLTVGALVGRLTTGTVTNCSTQAGTVPGYGDFFNGVGGLVGRNEQGGIVSDCSASSTVVGANREIGGLVGYNDGVIADSMATGTVRSNATATPPNLVASVVGGLVGNNMDGEVLNCHATGNVFGTGEAVGGLAGANWDGTIFNCYATGEVSAGPDGYGVGGLLGEGQGTVADSYATGNVTSNADATGGLVGHFGIRTISNCYATGRVSSSGNFVGGLIGANSGTVMDCYARGGVSGGDWETGGLIGRNGGVVTNCYSVGAVTGRYDVGGLVGGNFETLANCFWDTQTSGHDNMCGTERDGGSGCNDGCGKTTAEMQTESTFTSAGWDFNTPVWQICEGLRYPNLWYQYAAPVLIVEPGELQFTAMEGYASLEEEILSVRNCGGVSFQWQSEEDCAWLSVEPNSGSLGAYESNDVTVYANTSGLSKGYYYCELLIYDSCDPNNVEVVDVNLEVVGPILSVSADKLVFLAPQGGPTLFEQILDVRNAGGGTLNWEISGANDCNWLSVYPVDGQSRGEVDAVTVSVDASGLGLGFYRCELTVSDSNAAGSPSTVLMDLSIYTPGWLRVPEEFPTIQAAIDAAA
ncbi:MAG: GLUG motif-containing protein, partial [Planctomycetota bacterium]